MSFSDETLFTTSDILAREGEILKNVPFVNKHDLVKYIIEGRIIEKFSHIDDPISQIDDASVFREAAIFLNLALVLRENSSAKDDIFSIRAEFYLRQFEREMERAYNKLNFSEIDDDGVEMER